MNCLYCQHYCSITHTGKNVNDQKIFTANCLSCYVTFQFFKEFSAEIAVIIWTNIFFGGKEFCVKIYPGPTGNAPAFIIYYSKILSDGTKGWYDLMRFDFILDWIPQNAAEKIQSLKVFL
jgi:hypothetical protein